MRKTTKSPGEKIVKDINRCHPHICKEEENTMTIKKEDLDFSNPVVALLHEFIADEDWEELTREPTPPPRPESPRQYVPKSQGPLIPGAADGYNYYRPARW